MKGLCQSWKNLGGLLFSQIVNPWVIKVSFEAETRLEKASGPVQLAYLVESTLLSWVYHNHHSVFLKARHHFLFHLLASSLPLSWFSLCQELRTLTLGLIARYFLLVFLKQLRAQIYSQLSLDQFSNHLEDRPRCWSSLKSKDSPSRVSERSPVLCQKVCSPVRSLTWQYLRRYFCSTSKK